MDSIFYISQITIKIGAINAHSGEFMRSGYATRCTQTKTAGAHLPRGVLRGDCDGDPGPDSRLVNAAFGDGNGRFNHHSGDDGDGLEHYL
ncbi:hypothetical protein D3C85_1361270 [compost metagenome]